MSLIFSESAYFDPNLGSSRPGSYKKTPIDEMMAKTTQISKFGKKYKMTNLFDVLIHYLTIALFTKKKMEEYVLH